MVRAFVGAMKELPMLQAANEVRIGQSGWQPSRGQLQDGRRTLMAVQPSIERGPMSDRLSTAVTELVAALRDEIAAEHRPSGQEPDRLLTIDEAARALSIGRTALYSEIGARRIRSVKIGRRRLIPSSAVSEVASRRE